jgi:ATP-dependent DNA helicase RecG
MVTLRHEKLGAPQELIIEYLRTNPEITNVTARKICAIPSPSQIAEDIEDVDYNGAGLREAPTRSRRLI